MRKNIKKLYIIFFCLSVSMIYSGEYPFRYALVSNMREEQALLETIAGLVKLIKTLGKKEYFQEIKKIRQEIINLKNKIYSKDPAVLKKIEEKLGVLEARLQVLQSHVKEEEALKKYTGQYFLQNICKGLHALINRTVQRNQGEEE